MDKFKQVITLTVGIPASGKDTWAREMCEKYPDKTVVVNRDVIRARDYTKTGSIHDYKYTRSKERQITEKQQRYASFALQQGKSVIVSDTNLNAGTCEGWAEFAAKNDVAITYEAFITPLHTCIKRNAKRADYVPESVLIRMETKMRGQLGKYVHDKSNPNNLPECVIFDIDGTLADMKGVRGPFEWDKVGSDKPRRFVCEYLQGVYDVGDKVIIFSGRDSVCREQTELWLKERDLGYDDLFMRAEGSTTPDTIVKEEMFDKHIKGKYHVSHIVDDRKAVCQMWESMGFDVMNVGGFSADF
jgi:predicted kinase